METAEVPDWLPPLDGEESRWNEIGHSAARRIQIAMHEGLERLAVADQYARAILALNISSPQNAEIAHSEIENAITAFLFRGAGKGSNPEPQEIIRAVSKIADSLSVIDESMSLLFGAMVNSAGIHAERHNTLEAVHREIFGAIFAKALPVSLAEKIADSWIGVLPSANRNENEWSFSNPRNGRFALAASAVQQIAANLTAESLALPRRASDYDFVSFIKRLGFLYHKWTGTEAASPDRNLNQSHNWRGPFGRFVEAVWPLTPEGSGGEGQTRSCPSSSRIRAALRQ